jgi:hypothetical protein
MHKNLSFYQDRLGTNIGKTLKKRGVFVAKGNEPESIYAIMSGTHYNGGCCFD